MACSPTVVSTKKLKIVEGDWLRLLSALE